MQLDPKHTAFLGLHWMRDVIHPDGAMGAMYGAAAQQAGIVENAQRVVSAARRAGAAVAWTRVCFEPGYSDLVANAPLYHAVRGTGGLIKSMPGVGNIDELPVEVGDIDIGHNRICGFVNTSLDLLLRARGVDTLLVTGVATNVTVDSTARHASDLGYRTIVLADCCISDSAVAHQASIDTFGLIAEVATSEDVLRALGR